MPIYEYKCENGHVFDIMQRMSEDPLEHCVECEAPVKKLLRPVNISFRGSGFYSTDYKGSKKTEKDDTKSGGSEDTGSSEAKSGPNGAKKPDSSTAEKKAAKSKD